MSRAMASAARPALPVSVPKRQRTTPSRLVPTAAERIPGNWTLQLQPGGRRRATCLACQDQIEEDAPRMAKTSEVSSGGRWYHPFCVPGGLRPDDTLSLPGPGTPEMVHMVEVQQARNRDCLASTACAAVPTQLVSPDTGETVYGPPAPPMPADVDQSILNQLTEPPPPRPVSSAGDTEAPDPADVPLDPCVPEEDVLTDHIWLKALQCKASLLSTLTPNFTNIYADVKVGLIKDALLSRAGTEGHTERWWRLLLIDKLLFHKGGDQSISLNAKLRARLQAARDGEWMDLVTELLDAAPPPTARAKPPSESDVARRILAMTKQGSWSRAISAARADVLPDRSPQAWEKLRNELPKVDSRCSPTEGPRVLTEAQTDDLKGRLLAKIRQADNAASPGLLGSPPHLWKLLTRDDEEETTDVVLELLIRIACGDISEEVRTLLIHADLIAGSRPDHRVRPIEVPSFLRKTAMSALMEVLTEEIQKAAGPEQVGLKTPDGTSVAFGVLEHELHCNPTHIVASIDIGGAHSNIRRDALEEICAESAPSLGYVLRRWYHQATPKTWRGPTARDLSTESGLGQGSPEAAPLFCVGLGYTIRRVRTSHPSVRMVAFQDDIYLVGPLDDVLAALKTLDAELSKLGLKQNTTKLQLYTPSAATAQRAPTDLRPKFVDSLKILGQRLVVRLAAEGLDYHIGGQAAHRQAALDKAYTQMRHFGDRLRSLTRSGLPLAVAHRLWVLATAGSLTHLQSVDIFTREEMLRFNLLQSHHMSWMTGRELSERDLAITLLPLSEGGVGLPDHYRAALSNFLSAQNRLAHSVSTFLGIASVEEYFEQRGDLRTKLHNAKTAALAAGAPGHTIPAPRTGGQISNAQKARHLAAALHKQAREEIKATLRPGQVLRLTGQARRGASLWMTNVLPQGVAPADQTWATMLRQRTLMPAPGIPGPLPVAAAAPICGHTRASNGQPCTTELDEDGIHEAVCQIGNLFGIRHDRSRDWLADKIKLACGGRTQVEQPHPHANGTAGRMDIKHDSAAGHLDIDVIIPSLFTSNHRELLRRVQDPARAIRAAGADKHRTYGSGVTVFCADDLGGISAQSSRLIRQLAEHAMGDHEVIDTTIAWKAEMQHIILQNAAAMAQAARGQPRTA